ncbi:MAG: ATP-binding protein [Sedimenticola sp.]|nr:ATP-binding protein [Sedimenticola sp.]
MTDSRITRALLITMERVKLFYSGLGFAGLATIMIAAAVFGLNSKGATPVVEILSAGLVIMGIVQILLWYAWYLKKPNMLHAVRWEYYPLPIAFVLGGLWGAIVAYVLPAYNTDTGLLILLSSAASALLSIMFLAAIDLMVLLYMAAFLASLLSVINHTSVWPTSTLVVILLAYVIGLSISAAAYSVLFGIIARLRAGKQNVSGKLNLARVEMVGLHTKLSDEDEKRRDVEQELYVAKEAAETANMVKSEFLATMSHEIRTPLNGIVPLLEILRESKLDREQRQFVNTALNSSYHLMSIINDILDFSKIEAGKLDLESIEVNLRDLVESVVAMMEKSAERRGLDLDYRIAADVPAVVQGDPIRLRQVLTNLVSNAIKFTSQGGVMVELACRGKSRKTVEVVFAVKDTGDGISEEIQARLFRSFNQADASTTRKHGGTGLGLVISRRLVELMNGKIGVRSEQGKGSVFWFVVPMRKSIRDIPPDRQTLEGLRVMIVAGYDRQIQKIEQYLSDWGILYQRMDQPADALENLRSTAMLGESWAYELIILDAKSLGGRLNAFLHEVNTTPALGGLKRLLVGDSIHAATRMGVDGALSRQIKPGELQRILERMMDVQNSARNKHPQPANEISNQFLFSDSQADAWYETIPPNKISAPAELAESEIQLMGHVLIVEDNLVNLNVAKKMLLRLGLQCDVAQDGLDALRAIDNHQYDLVLMDCQMPRMDGYEATRAIRLREATKGLSRLPVIAMTANAMDGDREKCLDAGMDEYLPKPIMPATLRLMLSQWLPQNLPEALEPEGELSRLKRNASSDRVAAVQSISDNTGQSAVIDTSIIEELYEIMEEDVVSLLLSFLDAAPALIREVEAGILDGDAQQIIMPAHSLKSSSANVGAKQLSETARQIEMAARQQDLSCITILFERLREHFDDASKELRKLCEHGYT